MEDKMITRQEAINVLYQIMNSGIIDEELEDALQEIANCIEDENYLKIHSWGMPCNEYIKLHTSKRTDLPDYAAFIKECEEIYKRYSFE